MKLLSTKKVSAVLSLASVTLLAACGGGGGSGGSSGQSNTSAITSSNAQTVTAQALNGNDAINGGAASASTFATGVTITGNTVARTGLVQAALQQLYKGLAAAPAANLPTGVTTSGSSVCPGGGTISVTATYSVSNTVSNGDNLSITTDNCVENGQKMNGRLTIAFSNLNGSIGSTSAWRATLTLGFTNFSFEENGEIFGANGDMTLAYNQTNSLNATASISGNSLRSTLTKNAATVLDETLTAFSISDTISSTLETQSVSFTFADNRAAALTSYDVKTIAPFKQATSSSYPYEGSLTITAGNGSKATVTALSSTNVRIDVDTNGDGGIDQTINTTWAALKSLI